MRRTLKSPVTVTGVGLHGGRPVSAILRPALAGQGIVFRRVDLPAATGHIPARHDLVTDTRLCTRLTNAEGATVSTVEHVMAALAGLGITDCTIEIDGPEVPIMDGSAAPFVARILRTGLSATGVPARAIRIRRAVEVEDAGRVARLMPAPCFCMAFSIDFADPAIGAQRLSLALTGTAVLRELADCRTFGMAAEVAAMRSHGLGLGGSLDNAVVVDRGRVLNPGGLRRRDEFVRHKMLDAVGDLALAGAPILGRYEGVKAGHEMTNRLLRALFARPDAWEWATAAPGQVPGPETHEPSLAEARLAV